MNNTTALNQGDIDPSNWRANREELYRLQYGAKGFVIHPNKIGKTEMMTIANSLSKARSELLANALNTLNKTTMGSYIEVGKKK